MLTLMLFAVHSEHDRVMAARDHGRDLVICLDGESAAEDLEMLSVLSIQPLNAIPRIGLIRVFHAEGSPLAEKILRAIAESPLREKRVVYE